LKSLSDSEKASFIAGSHRYGNPSARIFVQLNSGAPLEVGTKTSAIVADL
jgi:hypothetical protein